MKKFVWDTSALLSIKEPDKNGYSPGNSLYKDLNDGWIKGPYLNIFPAISVFELNASVSRKHREGSNVLREFHIVNQHSVIYDINIDLIAKSADLLAKDGFNMLRGGDLIFACIAYIEKAYLVTLDADFKHVLKYVDIIDLNQSRTSANYRDLFR